MQRTFRREPETALPVVRQFHPREEQLSRFMRAELSQPEVVPIVRHLLAGCTRCLAVTRRLWELGERVPKRRED